MRTDPYCSHCGYSLVGLTESSKCPECGRPLVEVLTRDAPQYWGGKRYRSPIVIFGLPLVHVALGPHGDEPRGRARGIIAIGDVATGFFALGGIAFGIVAIGGLAVGVAALGGGAIGLLALGGGAAGGAVLGGGTVGVVAQGGGAIGFIAEGGGAVGYYAQGGGAAGRHVITPRRRDPAAVRLWSEWRWLLGPGLLARGGPTPTFAVWLGIGMAGVAALAALLAAAGYLLRPRAVEYR